MHTNLESYAALTKVRSLVVSGKGVEPPLTKIMSKADLKSLRDKPLRSADTHTLHGRSGEDYSQGCNYGTIPDLSNAAALSAENSIAYSPIR